ncbi:GroES-like protein [Cadophora sp. DSE1049]|nr:GroES-like protein [Cadophora sp. DSE1049]
MRAITLLTPQSYDPHNPPTSLTLTTLPLPVPSASQALLRITATAITPYELSWPMPASTPRPRIPAHDIAGIIVSSPSEQFRPGDRVFALMPPFVGQGGLAEYAVCDVKFLVKVPRGLGDVEAASVPRAALTAVQACGWVDLKEGEKVLVSGATGAVGRMVVQVVRRKVGEKGMVAAVGGVGSDDLKGMGAGLVVNYREVEGGRWEDVVKREVEGGKVDVVVDCIGGESLERGMRLVKSGGKVVTVGSPPPAWAREGVKGWEEIEEHGLKKLFFIVEEDGEQLEDIAELLESGDLKPSVGLVIDGLTEEGVRDAYSRGLNGGLSGSAVVKIA